MLRRLLAASLISLALPPAATADEIADRIKAAVGHYEQNRLGPAATALQIALGKIREQLGERIEAAIPAPPPDWTSNEGYAPGVGSRNWMTALGVNITRNYNNRMGARMTLTLMLDNPMAWSQAATHLGLMSPGHAEQMGYTRIEIEGLAPGAAFYRWVERSNSGEGVVLIPGRLFVRINAFGAAAAGPLRTMMQSWDIKRIKEIADIN